MMGDDGRSPDQNRRLPPAKQEKKAVRSGPRSLWIKRTDQNGFGFTLRHFIVYPPETYALLSSLEPRGSHVGECVGPMETIFVQSVTPDSGAAKAGLNIGDRLLGVNGKSVHNKTYSAVVHMIQESPDYLCLIVVPKEEDLIQLFFGRTAHNPETNERPNRASSRNRGGISGEAVKSSGSPARRSIPSLPPVQAPVITPHIDKMPLDNGDAEQAAAAAPRQQPGRANTLPEVAATVPGCLTPVGGGTGYTNNAFWDSLNALSFNSYNHENVMSRLRKSLRQKEEFLCSASSSSSTSPLHSSAGSVGPARSSTIDNVIGTISRLPQRITTPPIWPPAIPASSVPQALPKEVMVRHQQHSPGFVYGGAVTNAPKIETRSASLSGVESLPAVVRLDRIQEERGQRHSPSKQCSLDSTAQNVSATPQPPCFRLVSQRARQFESAHSLQPNIHLYRSELARLATKRGAPNVAVRRREFESRAADWRHQRESRSLETPTSGSLSPTPISGNRIIPVGSTKLHCDPPKDYHDTSAAETKAPTIGRPRSNSVETIPVGRMSPRSVSSDPPQQRHKAVRQDSYLAAVNKPVSHHHVHHQQSLPQQAQISSTDEKKKKKKYYTSCIEDEAGTDKRKEAHQAPRIKVEAPSPMKKPERPNRLDLVTTNRPAVRLHNNRAGSPSPLGTPDSETKSPQESSPGLDSVVRRSKPSLEDQGSEDERTTRRVSYLKATWGDRIHVDSDLELSDNEPLPSPHRRGVRKWRPPLFPDDIQRIVRLFEPLPTIVDAPCVVAVPQKDQDIIIEGPLYCKVTQLDGKKAGDRSWRSVWVVVRGNSLYLFKDKKDAFSETPVDHERLDMTNCTVSPAEDYTKRRHVFRLTTASQSELLLQTDCQDDMAKWIGVITDQVVSGGSNVSIGGSSGQNVSPVAAHKGLMKLTTPFRNRSPTGQSPVNKTRKPSQTNNEVPASPPKSKTWKGRVAKQLRRIQAGAGSPVSPTAPVSYPEGATIGVPLELCPKSLANEYVPLIVELCTRIVEDRGLEIIGIYRVPGNTAAVTSLTDAVNKGLNEALLDQDQRWTDVNVISSLLKLFFRRLPDCLLTNDLYPSFIQADRIDDPKLRVFNIRKLVQDLPDHHLHTLRHLIKHLQLVVEHSAINKMEAKNLAIVFGPTLVRAADDNMVTLVTDMSSQCRIVETLIHHADWCFSEDGLERLIIKDERQSSISVESESAIPNQTLLLDNVHKLEGMKGEVSRRDIVSSIITAANRKMLKTKSRKQVASSGDEIIQLEKTAGERAKDGRKSSGGSGGSGSSSMLVSGGSSEPETVSSTGNISTGCGNGEDKSVAGAIATGVRESVIFSGSLLQSSLSQEEKVDEKTEDKPNLSPMLTKQPTTEEGTIITYTGLSETTQERIRRFELETKAMLQRDKKVNPKDWIKPTAPTAISSKIAGEEERKRSEGSSPLAKWRQITCPGGGMGNQLSSSEDPDLHTYRHQSATNNALHHKRVVKSGSLDSLSDHINIAVSHHLQNNNNNNNNNNNIDSMGGGDLVSSLTLTFDAKMKSLGLLSPVTKHIPETTSCDDDDDDDSGTTTTTTTSTTSTAATAITTTTDNSLDLNLSFRDPSLHRSFTSPNLEFKVLEVVPGVCQPKNSPPSAVVAECDKKKEKKQEVDEKEEVEKDDEKENCCLLSASSGAVKLKRSESLNKRDSEKKDGGRHLRRTESLNKKESNLESRLKRSDSLTKTEKTDLNLSKRRAALEASSAVNNKKEKMKRKTGGGSDRSIKRRHTVGGTKDFDKTNYYWLDNKEREVVQNKDDIQCGKIERRTSSPDLLADTWRRQGPSVLVVLRPQSLLVAAEPLESHI